MVVLVLLWFLSVTWIKQLPDLSPANQARPRLPGATLAAVSAS
jgi:hypothetical protein